MVVVGAVVALSVVVVVVYSADVAKFNSKQLKERQERL